MKLKNRVVIEAIPALNNLSDVKLPVKTSYVIAKNIRELSKILEDIEKIKKQVFDKWVEKDKDGNPISEGNKEGVFKLKKNNEFNKEMNELLDIENDVNISTVTLDDLEGVDLTPGTIMSIDWMIENK
ncbi:hypothetical protein KO361_05405 [Candidatus Woesearchaeota archaeon]|nr:hypothetical protein [Candidatus Woesearchaeota archaeon]